MLSEVLTTYKFDKLLLRTVFFIRLSTNEAKLKKKKNKKMNVLKDIQRLTVPIHNFLIWQHCWKSRTYYSAAMKQLVIFQKNTPFFPLLIMLVQNHVFMDLTPLVKLLSGCVKLLIFQMDSVRFTQLPESSPLSCQHFIEFQWKPCVTVK